MAFSNSAQGSDSRSGQGERRRGSVDRAELLHDLVHNSTGGPACENVGERGVAGGLAFLSCAVNCAYGGFGAEQICPPHLNARSAPRPRRPNAPLTPAAARRAVP